MAGYIKRKHSRDKPLYTLTQAFRETVRDTKETWNKRERERGFNRHNETLVLILQTRENETEKEGMLACLRGNDVEMSLPDPANPPRRIVLVPGEPQAALFAHDVKHLISSVISSKFT